MSYPKGLEPRAGATRQTSTHYGGQSHTKKKDAGGAVPTITKKGVEQRHTSTNITSKVATGSRSESTSDVPPLGTNARTYAYETRKNVTPRRVKDGVNQSLDW